MTAPAEHPGRIVVVGAGLAGGRTCVALREAGYSGELVLIGDEPHAPYDRPPLSKGTLTEGQDPDLGLDLSDVDCRFGTRAVAIRRESRELETDSGTWSYDALVLATGARPVTLPGEGRQLTLRTREDAEELRAELRPGAHLVIVGAGWIGAEVSTAALGIGCRVTCVEEQQEPLEAVLGRDVGQRMSRLWKSVDLRTGVRVREVAPDGIVLADGSAIPADVVLTAVGVRPELDWLRDSGLVLDGGAVSVDSRYRTNDPHIYAVGDLAARWSHRIRGPVRGGHWDGAVTGAKDVASAVLGASVDEDSVPYFWSDQFGVKVQYVGQHGPGDHAVIREHPERPDRWGCAWVDARDRLTGHLSVGFPKAMVQARGALLRDSPVDVASLGDLTARL